MSSTGAPSDPALLHPNPVRIAVIGLGSGDTTYGLSGREETQCVTSIEIVAAELSVLRKWVAAGAPPAIHALLEDPRHEFHIDDDRAFLLRTASRFDIIEADPLWPRTAYSGNLYSVEYFALLRSRLATGGYAVSWLPTPRSRSSMVAAFPYVLVIGEIGIACDVAIRFDADEIRRRLGHSRGLTTRAPVSISTESSRRSWRGCRRSMAPSSIAFRFAISITICRPRMSSGATDSAPTGGLASAAKSCSGQGDRRVRTLREYGRAKRHSLLRPASKLARNG